ncbi:MAG: hypothetical protein BMS9Abin25_0038 [Gammaproteobacteria bacterium]|nr:MAG: hypothetical protein BMS9Abin25_0038 [Gammaproteobacteria bacterium]
MKDSSLRKKMIKGLIVSYVSVLGVVPSLAGADGSTQMLQFELTFGNKKPVSNFYMSVRPTGMATVDEADTDTQSMIRMPVFSTDRSRVTMLNPLPMFYANEGGSSTEGDGDRSTAQKTGSVLAGAILVVGSVAAIAWAAAEFSHSFDDICNEGCVGPIDIPDLSILDPNTGS